MAAGILGFVTRTPEEEARRQQRAARFQECMSSAPLQVCAISYPSDTSRGFHLVLDSTHPDAWRFLDVLHYLCSMVWIVSLGGHALSRNTARIGLLPIFAFVP